MYYYSKEEHQLKSKPVVDEHLMRDDAYVHESNVRYVYTFTEKDYENAEIIK